ncbi:MAG: hypothetical protein CW691_06120 [Candidatus Bathyarchaeum sp.]|nr:MAG: hypothetical protein CW691_06120 [Candidatus Bathyarchaeum sp.]
MASIDAKTVFKNIVIGLLAAGLFFSMLTLTYSWIKILIVASFLVCSIIWLLSHGKLKKALKYLVISLMVFGICFTSFESYVFTKAGYPSTYDASAPDVTLSYPNILYVSLTEIVQGIKETTAFTLFSLEHSGTLSLEDIELSTTRPNGRIEVSFYAESSSMGIRFASSAGHHYVTSVTPWIGLPSSQLYFQKQTPEETLSQFDNLGLQWFYDQACEQYQNKTGTRPNVTSLDVSTQWQEYGGYQGMTLLLSGWQQVNNDPEDLFHAEFQPDGTMLYISIPTN